MTGRTRRADLLLAAVAVGLPCVAFLLGIATTGKTFGPDPAGLGISIAVVGVCIGTGYAALRWYGRSDQL